MADHRRATRANAPKLTLVEGEDVDSTSVGLDGLREDLAALGLPEELLRTVLDGAGDPDEVVGRLVDAGVLPTPEDFVDTVVQAWQPLLDPDVGPLDAELFGSDLLGTMRTAASDEDDLPCMIADLVAQVERHGGAEAVALLRVLAVLAPSEVRPVATAAADRLVAAGLVDPHWVRGVGTPRFETSFGYSDPLGAQQSVVVAFDYDGTPHALVVLVDNDLGGGVKDCFVTDRPDLVRTEVRTIARRGGLRFHDYGPGQARAVLDRALAAPPCPLGADQVENVQGHLDLLRARVALLPAAPDALVVPDDAAGRRVGRSATMPTVHRVKVTLRGSKPPIWRRLEVSSQATLEELHLAIQAAFGWEDYHLWAFTTPLGHFGDPDTDVGGDGCSTALADVAGKPGDRIRYVYDFGDDWEHAIVVENVLPAAPGVAYPRCTAGRRAGPPEDCGGIWGYGELLEVLADPDHEDHAERLEWLGLDSAADLDPARFDLAEVNVRLSRITEILIGR